MDVARLDVLLVHSLPDICYLTGYQTPLADWYHCLILPRDGAPILQVCDTELAEAHTFVGEILPVSWERMDDAADQLIERLRSGGFQSGLIGIALRRPGLRPFVYDRLRDVLPHARFSDASNIVLQARVVKSSAEIECLRQAAAYSVAGMEAAIASIGRGVTDNTICAAASKAMIEKGSEYFSIDPIVRTGARSGITHGTAKRHKVEAGDPILMEFGGVHQRYCAPLLRTAVLGGPSRELQRLSDISLKAMDLLFANLRPGRTMDEVARSAAKALADLDATVRMRGYFGYSVGVSFPPVWVEHSAEIAEGRQDTLQPGMTFHAHRSMRIPGVVGTGFSEAIVITDSGSELLTHFPRQLITVK